MVFVDSADLNGPGSSRKIIPAGQEEICWLSISEAPRDGRKCLPLIPQDAVGVTRWATSQQTQYLSQPRQDRESPGRRREGFND